MGTVCELCGKESETILCLGSSSGVPCIYLKCSECHVEYLTSKEISINMYAKKMSYDKQSR
jgi:hypothetical protein